MNPSEVKRLIEEALYRAYEDTNRFSNLPPNEVHVTEITYCLRKAYYARMSQSKPPIDKVTILQLGRALHELIQKYVRNHEIHSELEVTYPFREITLHGTIDLLIDGTIIELKTVSKKPQNIYPHHYAQVNAYYHMLRDAGYDVSEPVYVVYINKRTGEVKIFSAIPAQNDFMVTLMRAYQLYNCLLQRRLPAPEPSHLCEYCEFRMECSLNGESK